MQVIINILAFLGALTLIFSGFVFVLYHRAKKYETHEITDGEYHFDKRV